MVTIRYLGNGFKMIRKGLLAWRCHYLYFIPALLVNQD